MSVTDPIFKPLKHCIYRLVTGPQPIRDEHEALQNFCELVEIILRKGAKHGQMFLLDVFVPRDYWNCFEQLYNSSAELSNQPAARKPVLFDVLVDTVRKSGKVTSTQGRGRYFIRLALQHRILHSIIEYLIASHQLVTVWYETHNSILAHPILSEIFLSLLRQISELTFELCLKNHSFLDETWKLPMYVELELCPSPDLGLRLNHVNGRVVVISLTSGSLAADSGKIEEGDVLDELHNRPLRNIAKGTIRGLLKKHTDEPILLSVTKRKHRDGSTFHPIDSLLKEIRRSQGISHGQDPACKSHGPSQNNGASSNNDDKTLEKCEYCATYVGSCSLKQNGGVDRIERAINAVLLQQHGNNQNKEVLISLGETDLTVTEVSTKQVIYRHSYTFITACGRCEERPRHIAYIVGDNTCLLATQFVAHVFYTLSLNDSRTLLQSIADGFERTHWFV